MLSCLWEVALFIFCSPYWPTLVNFVYEPTHLFAAVRTAVLLYAWLGWLVGGWIARSCGGRSVWYVGECLRACIPAGSGILREYRY